MLERCMFTVLPISKMCDITKLIFNLGKIKPDLGKLKPNYLNV